jgi:hypothetical protein
MLWNCCIKKFRCDEVPEVGCCCEQCKAVSACQRGLGWILLRVACRLAKEYPKELMELDSLASIDGDVIWRILIWLQEIVSAKCNECRKVYYGDEIC